MKRGPAPAAKISRPLLAGSFPRERLFRRLDEAVERSVVWVSGPPGSGKTTLVSGYVESRRLPCLWYRVDEGDADVATFFHYMGLAARAAAPRRRKRLPLPTPARLAGLAPFARRYFEGLFARLGSPAVLVFDDWQKAAPGSPLHEAVREGAALLPDGFGVVFLSRGDPAPDVVRAFGRRWSGIVGWRDLRLTLEETGEIARLQRRERAPETIRAVHERADGWAAGVVLLLERAGSEGIGPQEAGGGPPAAFVEYFAAEAFERLDGETRDFLLRTAFLPRMTAETAERLSGDDRAGQLLSYLNRHNFFTEAHPGPPPAYEYHTLFREFLLARAEALLPPDEVRRVRHLAATVLEESGQAEDAVTLLRECRDWEGLCRVIRKEARSLVLQGRDRTLCDWLQALPEEVRAGDPWLLYWMARCCQCAGPAGSVPLFEDAFRLFEAGGDLSGTLLTWAGAVETILDGWDDFSPLDRWIDWLDKRLAADPTFPDPETEARATYAMAAALVFRRPQHPDIGKWVDRSVALARGCEKSDPALCLQTLLGAARYFLWTGNRAGADIVTERIGRLARAEKIRPWVALTWKWMEAQAFLWLRAAPEPSLKCVSEGLKIARESGIHAWDRMLFAAGAAASLVRGDMDGATRYLARMEAVLEPERRQGSCQYHYVAAWLHLLRADVSRAETHARAALEAARTSGMLFPEVLCRLALAQVRHEDGERGEAEDELARARGLARQSRSVILEFMGLAAAAQFALDRGDEPEGLSLLRQTMALGRRQGYSNMYWWWRPDAMRRLCLAALEAGIEADYVRDLIRRRGLSPEFPPMEVEAWPWRIRVYTLGRFGLVRDGAAVEPSGKVQRKPLALLKALIALGGRDVPEEELADALWPEADGDRALQALAATVRRLRRLLGEEGAVAVREGRLTLSSRVCWVDSWAFERIVGRAARAAQDGPGGRGGAPPVRLLEKALAVYKGHFLAGEKDYEWAASHRERLRGKLLRCAMEAGRLREDAGEWEKAKACYRKGLEADDLNEALCRRFMACCHRLGRTAEALAAYQRCRKALAAAFATEPSPETRALLEVIKKSPEPVG